MNRISVVALTAVAMVAFAGNSILCRLALRQTAIDAASFTAIRITSGAVVLWLVCLTRRSAVSGSWLSAVTLFVYAAAFSVAYVTLAAGTGALLLFAAVQATMIAAGLGCGEQLRLAQWAGFALALAGLILLCLPGIAAPPLFGAILMLSAGVAWGVYSLRGKAAGDPVRATAGNFIRALPLVVAMLALNVHSLRLTTSGVTLALISGAITSGLGYVVWYAVLPALHATTAATVQLSAPVIAAVAGVVLLGEDFTLRLLIASVAVLSGIALTITKRAVVANVARS